MSIFNPFIFTYPLSIKVLYPFVLNTFNNNQVKIRYYNPLTGQEVYANNDNKQKVKNTETNKIYSGSGVIFLERNFGTSTPTPTILLVITDNNIAEDIGGDLHKNIVVNKDILASNAIKEVVEESQSLFIIDKRNIEIIFNSTNLFIDVEAPDNTYYRCYFVCITGTENSNLSDLFKQNKLKLNLKGPEFEETNDIQRFFLTDILKCVNNNMNTCNNINGSEYTVRDRTIKIIKQLNNKWPDIKNIISSCQSVSINNIDGVTQFKL